MMMQSREVAVDYMTPLGLTMLMDVSHYLPAPWRRDELGPIGTSHSFHHADEKGVGFDRTRTGSDAVSQYFPKLQREYGNIDSCPEELLLWFHHMDWDHKMKSGNTLWEELCYHYYDGTEKVKQMRATWEKIKDYIDSNRFNKVKNLLKKQEKEAMIWRDACILYFHTFSKMPILENPKKPDKPLSYYKNMKLKN